MFKSFVSILLATFSLSAFADDAQVVVQTELSKIVTQMDMRENVLSTNRMINLGDAAVEPLDSALSDTKTALRAKWAAAQALGEIGNSKAIPSLESCATQDDSWLKELCKNSIALIKGEQKRAGKVYLYQIGTEKIRIDVETGTSQLVP